MPFEHELAVFNANLVDLLDHEGRFVVVKGDEIHGPFIDYEAALAEVYGRYDIEPFLVKKIHKVEPIQYYSRDLPRAARVAR